MTFSSSGSTISFSGARPMLVSAFSRGYSFGPLPLLLERTKRAGFSILLGTALARKVASSASWPGTVASPPPDQLFDAGGGFPKRVASPVARDEGGDGGSR